MTKFFSERYWLEHITIDLFTKHFNFPLFHWKDVWEFQICVCLFAEHCCLISKPKHLQMKYSDLSLVSKSHEFAFDNCEVPALRNLLLLYLGWHTNIHMYNINISFPTYETDFKCWYNCIFLWTHENIS